VLVRIGEIAGVEGVAVLHAPILVPIGVSVGRSASVG
jgi:hypothetical protein